jgi:hypothetical protein
MSDDEIQAALAEVLHEFWADASGEPIEEIREVSKGVSDAYAAALLPVVRDIAAREAARELRRGVEELHVLRFNADDEPESRWPAGSEQVQPDNFYRGITLATLALRARALGLDPTHGKATT